MFRRILLLLCIAFVVVCYGYPFFALPLGEYTYKDSYSIAGVSTEYTYTYKFEFNGTGKAVSKVGDTTTTTEFTYTNAGRKIKIKDKDTGTETELTLSNMYQINLLTQNAQNDIGMWISIGVGALAVILVVLPSKRR